MTECFAVIAGGGTAGHLHPGLSVAEALVENNVAREKIVFLGSDREIDKKLVPAANFELIPLPGAGLQSKKISAVLKTATLLIAATLLAMKLYRQRRPKVILSVGGYASVPGALAGLLMRVPVVVHEQNAVPGRANRIVSYWAKKSAVSYRHTGMRNEVFTGNPVRDEILNINEEMKWADRREKGIPAENIVIVVTGGSLGARRINESLLSAVRGLDVNRSITIYHIIGERDWEYLEIPNDIETLDYRPVKYENDMPTILNIADLIVSRAGGSITAELAVVGLPAILIPLPNAPGDHQTQNAKALVKAGAALLIPDSECTGESLSFTIREIIDSPRKLKQMATNSKKCGNRTASLKLAGLLKEVAA